MVLQKWLLKKLCQVIKFFCLPGQMSKPRSSSFWEAVEKCEVIMRCGKKCLKRSFGPRKMRSVKGLEKPHQFSEKAFEMPK